MKKVIFVSLIAGLVVGCQKELSHSGSSETYTNLSQFFEKNQNPSQSFTANSSNSISVQTTRGTKIKFDPNSFVTLNDHPVTGDVSIEVKEILTPAEMILNRALTVSNGEPIESGGEFLIKVTKSGQELKLAPGHSLQMELPSVGVTMSGMRVFNGQKTNTEVGSTINWKENTNPVNTVFSDTIGAMRYLFADSIGWINCDRFMNEPRISYTVDPGNVTGFDSVSVVVHFSARNAVVPVYWDNATRKFSSSTLIAGNVTIIGIGIKDRKLQASFMPVSLQNNQTTTLSFSPYTEAEFKSKLSQLH